MVFLFSLYALTCAAAPQVYFNQKAEKKNRYITRGEFRGGDAGRSFLLNELKRYYSASNKIERTIFVFKDGSGGDLFGRPGYYSAKVNTANNKVIIEFSQVLGSSIDINGLKKVFERSPFVENIKMTYDPEDNGLSLQIDLKKNIGKKTKVEVFELKPELGGGRLAMDIQYGD